MRKTSVMKIISQAKFLPPLGRFPVLNQNLCDLGRPVK